VHPRRLLVASLLAAASSITLLGGTPASALAPTSASCIGQFFSSHAGLGAAHTGEMVGAFTSATACELGSEFGATISGGRMLPREDCGL
jgi:hypothetical protein